ncbi:MAG TPA: malto-oligosyltrehalose synthase [Thermoleophilaceae bacterium]|nr:malto-oligosyltrehalose synthase [Thermoleophilaceae bacterium]
MTELRATYRLQLGGELDFAAARELVPYFRELGISHLYLSPCFQARPGSTHGYDVTDPGRISEELGGEEGFRALAESGLGVILDIVPNHMAAVDENRYWADPELRRRFFDIDGETGRWRRFFDINHLAAVRQEDPDVFAETHRLALRLVREGLVDGLRIDHPDGLADPAGYLGRLRAEGVDRVWVEKILDPGERLRDWPVEGTVGYEFLNDAAALFVDPAGEEALTGLYAGDPFDPTAAKLEQAEGTFAPEVERLRRLHDAPQLERALSMLPVYRTYIPPVEDADRDALAGNPLGELLLEGAAPREFVTRFQQTTPAVMAKGVEDTAFYRYNRLLALNEVGGDPTRFGISVERFHAGSLERARRFPRGLLITQTHDTKRSGDVRARIGALAGMADEWAEQVSRWRALRPKEGPPAWTEAYLILQTLVGAWPLELERLEPYVEKALREAKLNTNWVEPDDDYERSVRDWCRALYSNRAFLDELERFAERAAREGERSALGQTLLKLTAPGVPDVYQGDELWALSLVDPDNRRPVDWGRRREALAELRAGAEPSRETIKLFLIHRALALRARRPEAFAGGYTPVVAGERCCAFLREKAVLAATVIRSSTDGIELDLPEAAAGRWRDVLSGAELDLRGRVPLERISFGDWPVALLERLDH